MRAMLKISAARALSHSGTATLMRSMNGWRHSPLALGYHRVVEDFAGAARYSIPAMLITKNMLENHLDWIGRRYDFLSLEDACSHLESARPFPRPSALVTFDDGYEDVYYNALPLLRRKGIPAAIFVVTQLLDTNKLQMHDELYLHLSAAKSKWRDPAREFAGLLSQLGILIPGERDLRSLFARGPFALTGKLLELIGHEDVKRIVRVLAAQDTGRSSRKAGLRPVKLHMLEEMRQAGFTIGSHTDSHPLLTHESKQDVLQELKTSRSILEKRLNTPITFFSYPDGRFDSEVVEAVHSCGYAFGFTTCRHLDPHHPLLTIPRKVLWERSCVDHFGRFDPAVMDCQVTRLFDFMSPCTQDHGFPAVTPAIRKVEALANLERS